MRLRSVYLENFRSYKKLNIKIKNIKFVVLTGKNGTGKTNLLEAISFLSPGKGFKNCRLDEVINTDSNSNQCSIFFIIEDGNERNEIGIGFVNESKNDRFQGKKVIHLNGKKLKKQSNLPNLVSLIWLTPEMDIFFRTNSLFRRKFIDRCIFNLNPDYLDYLRIYEKNLKERSKILKSMNRNYSFEEYVEIIEKITKINPDIAFSSDFIVGYPGETKQDFKKTLDLVDIVKYAQSFSFIYSPRPGTMSYKMKDKITDDDRW